MMYRNKIECILMMSKTWWPVRKTCFLVIITFVLTAVFYTNRSYITFDEIDYVSVIYQNSNYVAQCKIPHFNPWDKTVVDKLKTVRLPLYCHHKQPELSSLKDGKLVFDSNLVNNYNALNCSYTCVTRGKDDHEILYGDDIDIYLNSSAIIKPKCEFPLVKCRDGETDVYRNIHCQIVPNNTRTHELDQILPTKQRHQHHHVIMLIFDAVSHLNFLRLCPKTVKVLKNMYNATFFEGMARVGDNSYKNAMAFFAGKCHGNYSDDVIFKQYYDDWDFVWKRFAKSGYLTLDVQDSSTNIFLYLKKGFLHQPMDHRQRVFWLACDKLPGCSHYSESCYGNHAKHNLQFQYLQDFLTNYDHDVPKFVMFWNTCLCHDYIERLAYVDDDFAHFLTKNYDLLKNSFLMVMGDHGHKFSTVRNTVIGHFEANMPLFSLSLPSNIIQKHPEVTDIVDKNSKVLVSHFDTYVTLRDILKSQRDGWSDFHKQRDWSFAQLDVANAQSFLRPIKAGRSCDSIGIPTESCICEQYVPVKRNDTRVPDLASAVVKDLNRRLAGDIHCAPLTFDKVLTVTELSDLSRVAEYLGNKSAPLAAQEKQSFRVTIQVKPSDGTFEAHVRYIGSKYYVDGRILRTNRYGNQSSCVLESNPTIKEYCFCL